MLTVAIALAIPSGLFLMQCFSAETAGKTFGPAMLLWFTVLRIPVASPVVERCLLLNYLGQGVWKEGRGFKVKLLDLKRITR